jgi:hypothetical protein
MRQLSARPSLYTPEEAEGCNMLAPLYIMQHYYPLTKLLCYRGIIGAFYSASGQNHTKKHDNISRHHIQ